MLKVRIHLRRSSLLTLDLGEGRVSGGRIEASAELSVQTDAETAKTLEEALKPEASSTLSSRTRTKIESGPHGITLRIEASDLNALRAALNSYIRWMETALIIMSAVRER